MDSSNQLPVKTPAASSAKRKAEWFEVDEEHNTTVYVSGFPPDKIDEDKFVDLMKKYGIIAKLPIHGSPYSIKLYKNEDGSYKGDARCRYVHKESVSLAIELLDGMDYEGSTLHCKLAEFKLKGDYDPSKKLRVDPKAKQKQKKIIDKLLSWETKEPAENRQKKVILKYMFTPDEIVQEPELLIELKDEVEERCKELVAEPKRVDVYDKHQDGVIAITFAEPQQACNFVDAMADEYYAGRKIEASLWDGRTSYKIKETDEESEERLERWKQDIQKSDPAEEAEQDRGIDTSGQISSGPPLDPSKQPGEDG